VQLDHFDRELSRGIDLFQSRINKQADPNARGVKPFYRGFKFLSMGCDIKTAFGRNFLSLLRDETDFIRHNAKGNIDNLGGVAHFEIQFGHDVLAQSRKISILYVAPISAQMGYDPASAGSFADCSCHKRIWLCVLGFRHRGVPRLTQRRHVIDINSQAQTTHWSRQIGLTQSL
jgi:hypothetical protein